MEQLPVLTEGVGLEPQASSVNANGQVLMAANGLNAEPNARAFAKIAEKIFADAESLNNSKLGLPVAVAKLSHSPVIADESNVEQSSPLSGNIVPYGDDALTINLTLSSDESQLEVTVPSDNAQLRLQQLVQNSKLETLKAVDLKLPIKDLEVILKQEAATEIKTEIFKPKQEVTFEDKIINLKMLPKNSIQNQNGVKEEKIQLDQIGDLVKRISGNAGNNNFTESHSNSKSHLSDQFQTISNIGALTRNEAKALAPTELPKIQQAVSNPQWGNELANRVVWVAKQNFQAAQIRINPANLGPIELRISIQNEQASITFISNHAQVREAIEQSMPKLKEMFEENGFKSLDVDISNQSEAHRKDEDTAVIRNHKKAMDEQILENETELGHADNRTVGLGLIDYFA